MCYGLFLRIALNNTPLIVVYLEKLPIFAVCVNCQECYKYVQY
jgi:hypothetical protein